MEAEEVYSLIARLPDPEAERALLANADAVNGLIAEKVMGWRRENAGSAESPAAWCWCDAKGIIEFDSYWCPLIDIHQAKQATDAILLRNCEMVLRSKQTTTVEIEGFNERGETAFGFVIEASTEPLARSCCALLAARAMEEGNA